MTVRLPILDLHHADGQGENDFNIRFAGMKKRLNI
jgi:hypothetical protein